MPPDPEKHSFTSPPSTHTFAALLLDMDGTLIDSTTAIEHHWRQTGAEIGVDGDTILQTSHGRRSIDVLRLLCPSRANWEYVRAAEAQIPLQHGASAVPIPGARTLLSTLTALSLPWAIVTSGTLPLVTGWLDVLALPPPAHLVTAEDVAVGKPDPACYRLGAERLGISPGERVLVVEDAPAGVRAGKAAGFAVLGVATTHAVEELREQGADWVVRDLRSLGVEKAEGGGGVRVEIREALV